MQTTHSPEISTLTSTPSPLAEQFFAAAITRGALAHGYILKGKNTSTLYQMALRIAQALNCSHRPQPLGSDAPITLSSLACGQCKDCRWISKNAHPAVMTLSRLTYQVNDKGELMTPEELEKQAKKASSPTQIKTDQIGQLIHHLTVSSDACRVVIFTDAEERPASQPSAVPPPYEWQCLEANAEKSFHVRPLDRSVFNAFSVNKFLKTLEEPPPRTLFLFLTETEEQLLDTIVSRCQVVPCLALQSPVQEEASLAVYADFYDKLCQHLQRKGDIYQLVAEFQAVFIEGQGLSASQALTELQQFLRQKFVTAPMDTARFASYRILQQTLEKTITLVEAKANENASLLNLFIELSKQLKSASLP
jgi:hypothetical protein